MKLFREEVLAARAGHSLGSVQLAQSIPLWMTSLLTLVLASCLISYGVIGTYARKAHITGVLVPQGGEVNIAATAPGRVTTLRVSEGQAVAEGEVLMVLDTDRSTVIASRGKNFGQADVGDTAAIVSGQLELRRQALLNERATRQVQAQVRGQAIRARLQDLDSELAKLDDEIALQVQKSILVERSVQRYDNLEKANFVSPVQVQAQQEALIEQKSKLRALERIRLNLRREGTGLRAEDVQNIADLAAMMASAQRELAMLNQESTENTARRTTAVVAPRAGIISAVAIGAGQWVTTSQTMAALRPRDAILEAHLYAPSRTAGFVTVGQDVLLRYSSYPYQKFGLQLGTVAAISQSAFASSDLAPALQSQFGHLTSESLYRVTVALASQHITTYGEQRPLKAGMALEADIVQDRRTIIEWIFEPLFAAAKRA